MALWLLCRLDGCEVRLLQKSFGSNWRYLSDSCYLCLTFRAVLATYGGTCSSLMRVGDLRSVLFIVGYIWKNREPIADYYLS